MVYVIIALAVVIAVAAAIIPEAATVADREVASRTYAQLADLDTGIVNLETAVTTQYPATLHQLTTQITTADTNTCGATYKSAGVTAWTNNSVFSHQYITTGGVYTPIGTINDAIEHAFKGAPMYLRIPAVDTAMLSRMDALVDGSDGGAAGTILFTIAASPTADLVYRVGFAPSFTLANVC
jgi:hypothetical protein